MDSPHQSNGLNGSGLHSNGSRFLELLANAGWSKGCNVPKSLALTGCHLQSGVSRMVREMAIAAADSGADVLIIDCNLRHPTVHRQFTVTSHPGLCEALANPSILDDAIFETKTSGLYVMPFGRGRRSTQRYRDAFQVLLNIVMNDFDLVLLDMPRIKRGKPAVPWFSAVDGVILVMELGQVNASEAQAIQNSLQRVDANICGVVLNRFIGER